MDLEADPRTAALDFLKFQRELGVVDVPRPSASAGPASESEPVSDAPPEAGQADPVGEETLDALEARVSGCRACALCENRNTVVFGSGNPDAEVMFIGEAPGREEDLQGLPFVGAAGDLLTKMIEAMQLSRGDVYIANVIKCRPPGNRDPRPEEIEQCEPHLIRQIARVQPAVICALGRVAAQALLKSTDAVGRLRGKVYDYHGVKLIPTYHPAALLRNPQWKRPTWEDLKRVRFEYDGTRL